MKQLKCTLNLKKNIYESKIEKKKEHCISRKITKSYNNFCCIRDSVQKVCHLFKCSNKMLK